MSPVDRTRPMSSSFDSRCWRRCKKLRSRSPWCCVIGLGAGLAVMVDPGISVLIAAAAALAFVLPPMPRLCWMLAIMGYFLLIAGAIVAISLQSLSHLRMDVVCPAKADGRAG